MSVTTEKDGTQVYTVSRLSDSSLKIHPPAVYKGNIKALTIPLSFRTQNHKKNKHREIRFFFLRFEI